MRSPRDAASEARMNPPSDRRIGFIEDVLEDHSSSSFDSLIRNRLVGRSAEEARQNLGSKTSQQTSRQRLARARGGSRESGQGYKRLQGQPREACADLREQRERRSGSLRKTEGA